LGSQDSKHPQQVPQTHQAKGKQYIHDIWIAETRENAEKAFNLFILIIGHTSEPPTQSNQPFLRFG
jgi:hypothetical protein